MIAEKGVIMSIELLFKLVFGSLVGYLMFRFKRIEEKAEKSMTRNDVKELVADKLAPIEVKLRDVKDDLHKIDSKLDKLIDRN